MLPSEATLALIADPANSHFFMSRRRMLELFPVICRDDESRGWRTLGRKLPKRVFICCDNDDPEEKGVLVVRMDWNGNIAQVDSALQKAESEAVLQETRVPVEGALAKARIIADEVENLHITKDRHDELM